jgi:hypothetical protein
MAAKKQGFPRTFEDKLLFAYWKEVGGVLYLEVPVGRVGEDDFPTGSKVRRIDAVRLPAEDPEERKIIPSKKHELKDLQAAFRNKHDLEVIEVKKKLNRLVFGQVIAGVDMFEKQYRPFSISPIIVFEIDDPAMEWVCRKHGIETICPLGRKMEIVTKGEEEE